MLCAYVKRNTATNAHASLWYIVPVSVQGLMYMYVEHVVSFYNCSKRLQFWRRRGAAVIVWTMTENEAREFQKKLKVPVIVDVLPS